MWGDIGRGLLTGQFRSPDDFEDGDFRKYSPRFSKEVSPDSLCFVPLLSSYSCLSHRLRRLGLPPIELPQKPGDRRQDRTSRQEEERYSWSTYSRLALGSGR